MTMEDQLRRMDLPYGVTWLTDAAGHFCFPIYGKSGGITPDSVAYLVIEGNSLRPVRLDLGRPGAGVADLGGGWKSIAIDIGPGDFLETKRRVVKSAEILLKFMGPKQLGAS